MLVMFRFKNFGPFKDETVLDMRAIKSYKEHPYNLITECNECNLLKVVAVYGANASGKSNFVDAYDCFLNLVNRSFRINNKEEEDSILKKHYYPFLFDSHTMREDIEFEAVYHLGGYEYKYGFIYNQDLIKYEWLYKKSLSTNRQSTIIERSAKKIDLGNSVRTSCEKYTDDIAPNVLALSFFSSLNLKNDVFRTVVFCITDILPLSLSCDDESKYMLDQYFSKYFDEDEKTNLLKFLNAIDVGIKDISVKKNNDKTMVFTSHKTNTGELISFPIEIESDGTRRAIAIYSYIRVAVLYGKGLIIDEFNNQLHPLLQKFLIDLFYEDSSTGQLVYTTHDTSLMDRRFMRRDQIWFIDKDSNGVSSLYSLSDFKIRNDKSSFKNDYLGGVYGAIPNLNDFSFMEDANGNG